MTTKEKNARLGKLIEIQSGITYGINKSKIGEVYEVLVEGVSSKDSKKLCGLTSQNKTVNFPGDKSLIGKIVKVKYYLSDSMKSTVSVNLNLINRKASINGLPFYSIGNSAILGMEENFTLTFNTKIDVKSRDTIQMFTHNTGLFDTQVSASVDIQYADNEGVTE